jgi:hypothetical protein
MTAKEIMKALEAGKEIVETRYMTFKYGKLEKAVSKIIYRIDYETIKSSQFLKIRNLLSMVLEDYPSKTYKLKTE